MDDRQARREAARRVAGLLRHPEATAGFSAVLANGRRQVLVVMDYDTVGPLFKRVRALRGPVNVAVVRDDEFDVFACQMLDASKRPAVGVDCPVTKDSEVGMLVALLKQTGKPATCRLVEPDYQLELINPDLMAPA